MGWRSWRGKYPTWREVYCFCELLRQGRMVCLCLPRAYPSSFQPSTDGSIRFDYGYIDNDTVSPFHTRQLTFPILFTVYHTLELHSLDIIRFPKPPTKTPTIASPIDGAKLSVSIPNGYFSGINGNGNTNLTPRSATFGAVTTAEDILRERMMEERGDEWCLLGLCFRNVYGVPFEVELLRTAAGEGGFRV
jgi:hypothetical protein